MSENYREPEDLLSDESFLSWYFRSGKEGDTTWELWMAGHPDRTRLVEQAVTLLQATRLPEKAVPAQQMAAAESALFKKIGELSSVPHAATGKSVLPLYRDRRWMVAAAIFVVLAIGLLLAKMSARRPEIKTAYGQLTNRQLPDGTEVMMNANSRLSYSRDWKDGIDREVWMDGEAFFHVSKTPLKSRFIVHTVHFDIIVTGTRFNVVNRHGVENVLLEEGSVILHTRDGKELNMKPGDFVAFRDEHLQKRPIQHDSLVAWKEQKLVFDKTPLRELVKVINDQYGVRMELENESLGDSTITAIMPANNLDLFLATLEGTSEFDIIKDGDHITIRAHSR